jgi:hypothetical protein
MNLRDLMSLLPDYVVDKRRCYRKLESFVLSLRQPTRGPILVFCDRIHLPLGNCSTEAGHFRISHDIPC